MITQSNRVKQLDRAKDVVADLEAELEVEMTQARSHLCSASEWIRSDDMYQDYLEDAMGRVAGEAIRTGHDDIAASAAEVVEPLESDNE